ncbi:MAG: hypothetical protein Q7R33_01000 [Nitrosarchaeum sp.]|nr:hypothetical protein [Nitrosarchaeum sp.]
MLKKNPEIGNRVTAPILKNEWAVVTKVILLRDGECRVSVMRDLEPYQRHEIVLDWNVCLLHGDKDPFTGEIVKDRQHK